MVVADREDNDVEVGARFVTEDLEINALGTDGVMVKWSGLLDQVCVFGLLDLGRDMLGLVMFGEEGRNGCFYGRSTARRLVVLLSLRAA